MTLSVSPASPVLSFPPSSASAVPSTMNFSLTLEWSKKLKKESYFTNPLFILHTCFVNDGKLYEKELLRGTYALYVYSQLYDDISHQIIELGFDEDIATLKKKYAIEKTEELGLEFFYSADEWIALTTKEGEGKEKGNEKEKNGRSFKDIKKNIDKFKKEHPNAKILNHYPEDKVLSFINSWAQERRKKNDSDKKTSELTKSFFDEDLRESIENIRLVKNLDHKAIYVEEEGKLLGFCIFFRQHDNFWIALMQKTVLGIRGLPQYLYHLKAKEMGKGVLFSTGTGARDEHLESFKKSLQPVKTKMLTMIYVGEKVKK